MTDPGSRVELELLLAKEPPYAGGETIRGHIVAHPPPGERCIRLGLYLVRGVWGVKGDAFDRAYREGDQTLVEGRELAEGERLAFQLELPHQPPSYDGDTVSTYWILAARSTWSGETPNSEVQARLEVNPAELRDVARKKGAELSPGAYRESAASAAGPHFQLWRLRSVDELIARLGEVPALSEMKAFEREAQRTFRRDRVGGVVRRGFFFLAKALALIFILGPLYLKGADCGREAFSEGSVSSFFGFLAILLFTFVPVVFLAGRYVVKKLWPRLRYGPISLDLVDPPTIAALGERPEFELQVVGSAARPVDRLQWELRVEEQCMWQRSYTSRGNRRTETKWEFDVAAFDSGDLQVDRDKMAQEGGQLIRFSAKLAELRPSTLIIEGRELRWKLVLWCRSLDDVYRLEHDLLVVPFRNSD